MSTAPEATRDATRTAPPNWYPDPREPGQLRWWSGIAWTEHVAPLPARGQRPAADPGPGDDTRDDESPESQPTAVSSEDDEERATRGRRALDAPVDAPGSVPRRSDVPLHSAAISLPYLVQDGPTSAQPDHETADDAPIDSDGSADVEDDGIDDASEADRPAVSARITTGTGPVETVPVSTGPIGTRRRRSTAATPVQASTLAGWVIALSPLLFLGAGVAAWISATQNGIDYAFVALLVAPYAITVLLAVADRVSLRRLGHRRAPSWAWALLTPLAYLITRVIAVGRPAVLWTWCVLAVLGGVAAAVGFALFALR